MSADRAWKPASCADAERIRADKELVVLSGYTDVEEDEFYRIWGDADGRPVLRERIFRLGGPRNCIHEVPVSDKGRRT